MQKSISDASLNPGMPGNMYCSLSAVVEYKGMLAYGYGTACMEDGKMIYGYYPGNEYFMNDLRYYPKVEKFFYEEIVENFKTQERNFNFENAVGFYS